MSFEEEIAQALLGGWDEADARDAAKCLMPLVKRAQAEAIRAAADALNEKFQDIPAWVEAYREGVRTDEWMAGGVRMVMSAVDVLRARADWIEEEAGDGHDAN